MTGARLQYSGEASVQRSVESLNAVRQGKIKGIQIRKEKVKGSLFTDNLLLYTANSKDFTKKKKKLELIMNSVKLQDRKSTDKNKFHMAKTTTIL